MPRYTNAQRDEAREKILVFLEEHGGDIQWGVKGGPDGKGTTAPLAEAGGIAKGAASQFLHRMARDGLIVLNQENKYIKGVSLPKDEPPAPQDEKGAEFKGAEEPLELPPEVAPAPPPPPPPVTNDPLENLRLRVQLVEEHQAAVMKEAEEVHRVIEFLENPPPEYDATTYIRLQLRETERKMHELERKLEQRTKEASAATDRLAGANIKNAELERIAEGLEKNMRAMLDTRLRSGMKVREALMPNEKREIEQLMKRVPKAKGA